VAAKGMPLQDNMNAATGVHNRQEEMHPQAKIVVTSNPSGDSMLSRVPNVLSDVGAT